MATKKYNPEPEANKIQLSFKARYTQKNQKSTLSTEVELPVEEADKALEKVISSPETQLPKQYNPKISNTVNEAQQKETPESWSNNTVPRSGGKIAPDKYKSKNNRFITLTSGAQDWRKKPNLENLNIPANISPIEKAPNNYLYIAENEKGIVKVGVTKNNPYERVESFSQYYPDKFRLVTFFNIKNLDRLNVEMFFHEILNSQFLNINYLSRVLPDINETHKKIVNDRLNGYTELFVENKTILKNLLIFLNLIDVIDLKLYDIEEIQKIKDYQLGDVKLFKKTKKDLIYKEKNKLSPIKPLINNKQNLLLKNAKFFFSAIDYKDLKHLSFDINADKILFKLKSKELLITNFIYTNLAPDLTQALIKTKIYRAVHFKNLVEHITNLRKHNARVSTQFQDKALLGAPLVTTPSPEPYVKRTYRKKSPPVSTVAAIPNDFSKPNNIQNVMVETKRELTTPIVAEPQKRKYVRKVWPTKNTKEVEIRPSYSGNENQSPVPSEEKALIELNNSKPNNNYYPRRRKI